MTRRMALASIAAAVALCIASASAHAQSDKSKKRTSGTLVTLTPMPYSDLKSFVLRTSAGEEKFTLAQAADVPRGLKPGDTVSVDYRVENGIHWASAIKREGSGNKTRPKGKKR